MFRAQSCASVRSSTCACSARLAVGIIGLKCQVGEEKLVTVSIRHLTPSRPTFVRELWSFPEPQTTLQHEGGIMESSDCGRDSAAESSGSERREEPGAGSRSELLTTCPPERYRTAKFSLAAYLLCWVVLRWYQVRFVPNMAVKAAWRQGEE